jgi:hypothetical protein
MLMSRFICQTNWNTSFDFCRRGERGRITSTRQLASSEAVLSRGNSDAPWLHTLSSRLPLRFCAVRACKAECLDASRTRFTYHKPVPAGNPVGMACTGSIPDFSRSTCTHWHHCCIICTHHSCAPPATSYHTQYAPEPDRDLWKLGFFLNTDHYNSLLEDLAKPNLFSP